MQQCLMLMSMALAINEGMQTKPDYVPLLIRELGGCYNDIHEALLKNHDTGINDHKDLDVHDEENLTDLSCDKHEESIVWKGGPKPDDFAETQIPHLIMCDRDCQPWQPEEIILAGRNQLIDWWAATWGGTARLKEAGDELNSTLSLVHMDLSTQEGTLSWSDAERPKASQGSYMDIYNSYTDSSLSTTLENASTSLHRIHISPMPCSTGCHSNAVESLCQAGLTHSQKASEVFAIKALQLEEEKIFSMLGLLRHQAVEDSIADNESNKSVFKYDVNEKSVSHDSFAKGSVFGSCRYSVNTEDLDKIVHDTRCCKENIKKDIDSLKLLRAKAEQEEMAAKHAKAETASGCSEIFKKVEEMRQQMSCKRADYEMRAAEVYGEKSVLSMEARELKGRLLEAQAEQSKALFLVEDIRSTLLARSESASQAKKAAMEETALNLELASELLATEQAAAQKLDEDLKTLEVKAERCRQLREFLVERGNMVDSLQGELAVLYEDILMFKKQVDEGIPLSGSRSLSWSRMSHLTTASFPPTSTSPNHWLFQTSLSSTSLVSIASVTSELSKNIRHIRPIECALHSQYFSPGCSVVEVSGKQCLDNTKGCV